MDTAVQSLPQCGMNIKGYAKGFDIGGKADEKLTAEAAALVPQRDEFKIIWRYLISHSDGGLVVENAGCLCRKIARYSHAPCSYMRAHICLDVFNELGLIELTPHPKYLHIRITSNGRKVDLNASTVLRSLMKRKVSE